MAGDHDAGAAKQASLTTTTSALIKDLQAEAVSIPPRHNKVQDMRRRLLAECGFLRVQSQASGATSKDLDTSKETIRFTDQQEALRKINGRKQALD